MPNTTAIVRRTRPRCLVARAAATNRTTVLSSPSWAIVVAIITMLNTRK
jgi:hypothetical protein